MCDSWACKDGDKQRFLFSPYLFIAAALFTPPSFFLLFSLYLFFFSTHHFHLDFFFHSTDHILLVSCLLPVRGQGDKQEEVTASFSHTQSFQDHWPRHAKNWNMLLTEQVNLNYRKTLYQSFSILHLCLYRILSSQVLPSALCL